LNAPVDQILVASTGAIGKKLPMSGILSCIRALYKKLSVDGGEDAAEAILTTDTRKKEIAVQIKIGGKKVTVAGIAKGSGMIAPNMATMFAFITTDAFIPSFRLKALLKDAVNRSFNMTVVDKDMSTNDCVFALANGLAKNRLMMGKDETEFKRALEYVCEYLAKEIARDGEGATKLIEVKVSGAWSVGDARLVAKAVAGSDLVKSAMFGEDPNFGRIMAAVGYSGAGIKPELVSVFIGGAQVVKDGRAMIFDGHKLSRKLAGKEVLIDILLGQGKHMATAWGCDLTYDYVKINAEYHT
jgi:glutamate N-acetyltransferase/amino-acid N-acetyltransferase